MNDLVQSNREDFLQRLAELEAKAMKDLNDCMVGFTDKDGKCVLTCPWLRYLISIPDWNPQQVKGILILQDWGLTGSGQDKLDDQIKGIAKSMNEKNGAPDFEDNTIRNLRTLDGMQRTVAVTGQLIVMEHDAVWGCKKGRI